MTDFVTTREFDNLVESFKTSFQQVNDSIASVSCKIDFISAKGVEEARVSGEVISSLKSIHQRFDQVDRQIESNRKETTGEIEALWEAQEAKEKARSGWISQLVLYLTVGAFGAWVTRMLTR